MKHRIAAAVLMVGLLIGASTALAQHHGGHNGGHYSGHYGGHWGGHGLPVHHGSYFGHDDWSHVIPHHPSYVGAYYTTGQAHYYTPSPVTGYAPAIGAPAGPVTVQVQRPVELAFGGFSRYEDLGGRLALEANALCLDMHYNYRHNRNFAEVYREAYNVLQAANYLHGKEHQGDREAITKRMVEVDALFHHVQEEIRGWSRATTKQIGVNALPEKVEGVEAVLHHLCHDVGVKPHDQPAEVAPAPSDLNEALPPPPRGA